ncbi:synaptonemal complex central element protein 1-like [Glandiceps talaboti]
MSLAAFQVDVIIDSIQELQQEKAVNEQRLNKVRNQRRTLEIKLDSVSARHAQARDTNHKMIETLKIAQNKVSQTQSQIDSQQKVNKTLSEKIKELNDQVKQQEERKKNEINSFECKLEELARKFLDARHYYAPDSLHNEIHEVAKQREVLEENASVNEQEANNLIESLEKLKMEDDESRMKEDEIPTEVQLETYNMFKESYQMACNKLQELKDEKCKLSEEIQRLSEWSPQMGTKIQSMDNSYQEQTYNEE